MKKHVMLTVLLSAVIACLPSTGLAINPGAHIYVTEQVFGSDDVDLLLTSISCSSAFTNP